MANKKTKKWDVDIRFSPSICIHNVEAATAEEAEQKVADQIGSPDGLQLTPEQTRCLTNDLFENVDEIECVGQTHESKKGKRK